MSEPLAKPEDFAAERCGHNYQPEHCPHDDCGYREALARIVELEAELAAYRAEEAAMDEAAAELAEIVERMRGKP